MEIITCAQPGIQSGLYSPKAWHLNTHALQEGMVKARRNKVVLRWWQALALQATSVALHSGLKVLLPDLPPPVDIQSLLGHLASFLKWH